MVFSGMVIINLLLTLQCVEKVMSLRLEDCRREL
jgi:hypothetical protein